MSDQTEQRLTVQRYHDGEMSAAEAAAFESALTSSPALADELAAMRQLSSAIGRATPARASMSPLQMARLKQVALGYRESVIYRTAKVAAAIAAAVIVACSIMIATSNEREAVHGAEALTQMVAVNASDLTDPAAASPTESLPGAAEARFSQWLLEGLDSQEIER